MPDNVESSNAFVKSNEKTWTYWSVDNITRTVLSKAMTAAVVELVGLKSELIVTQN